MLKRFAVKNYKNFNGRTEISFDNVRNYEFNKKYVKDGLLNKIIVLGKNGSGKSNIIFSLGYVARLILSNPYVIMKEKDINRMNGPVNYKGNADEVSKFYFTF